MKKVPEKRRRRHREGEHEYHPVAVVKKQGWGSNGARRIDHPNEEGKTSTYN